MSQPISFAVLGLLLGVATGSVMTWAYIATCWKRGLPILEHAPRHNVPWGPIGLVIAVVLLLAQMTSLSFDGDATAQAGFQPEDFIWQSVLLGAIFLGATLGIALMLKFVNGASAEDLGLPASLEEAASEIVLGMVTCLAAILPVYTVKWMTLSVAPDQNVHPLLKELNHSSQPGLILVAAFSAVIVAPVFEEFLYRVLLQGWLEKWERLSIAARLSSQPLTLESADLSRIQSQHELAEAAEASESSIPSVDSLPDDASPYRSPLVASAAAQAPANEHVTIKSWAGLPLGLVPIAISALLFALAHVGHGWDPVPLFILGMIFGYVYLRTHRYLPCVVAHMSFNGISLGFFWFGFH